MIFWTSESIGTAPVVYCHLWIAGKAFAAGAILADDNNDDARINRIHANAITKQRLLAT